MNDVLEAAIEVAKCYKWFKTQRDRTTIINGRTFQYSSDEGLHHRQWMALQAQEEALGKLCLALDAYNGSAITGSPKGESSA